MGNFEAFQLNFLKKMTETAGLRSEKNEVT